MHAKRPPRGRPLLVTSYRARRSVVIDNHLAAVMVDVPVAVALLDDDGVVVAVFGLAYHLTFAHHFAVAMVLTHGHTGADRADVHADFVSSHRQRSSNHRG